MCSGSLYCGWTPSAGLPRVGFVLAQGVLGWLGRQDPDVTRCRTAAASGGHTWVLCRFMAAALESFAAARLLLLAWLAAPSSPPVPRVTFLYISISPSWGVPHSPGPWAIAAPTQLSLILFSSRNSCSGAAAVALLVAESRCAEFLCNCNSLGLLHFLLPPAHD